ncbi:hypothetical protein BC834DRAFT_602220 [Gloeopeniophorella convolvens]|nr:hypothetical protein BC834DRAFT_602220 [Gloeopeniophorella convolvens]
MLVSDPTSINQLYVKAILSRSNFSGLQGTSSDSSPSFFSSTGTLPLLEISLSRRSCSPIRTHLCRGEFLYHELLFFSQQTCVGLLCVARVYAIYLCSRRILCALVILSLAGLSTAMWSTVTGTGSDIIQVASIISGCSQWVGQDAGRGLAITWGSLSVFDTVIFLMTLYKSLTFGRDGVRLLDVLMRDGLTNMLATVMISRLVINIRAENHRLCTAAQEMTSPTVIEALNVVVISITGLGDIRPDPQSTTDDMC